jgi:hypothetical protein
MIRCSEKSIKRKRNFMMRKIKREWTETQKEDGRMQTMKPKLYTSLA